MIIVILLFKNQNLLLPKLSDYLFQRNDIATAISKFDQFDFLIDIVPREELKPARRPVRMAIVTCAFK